MLFFVPRIGVSGQFELRSRTICHRQSILPVCLGALPAGLLFTTYLVYVLLPKWHQYFTPIWLRFSIASSEFFSPLLVSSQFSYCGRETMSREGICPTQGEWAGFCDDITSQISSVTNHLPLQYLNIEEMVLKFVWRFCTNNFFIIKYSLFSSVEI